MINGNDSRVNRINVLKREKMICLLILGVLLTIIQFVYIQAIIPPQVGWWNYYGWQLNEGKYLYKDLYCFLPPYFVWLMAFLYKVLGINLFYYQIVGMIINYIAVAMVFVILCRVALPLLSMIACFIGAVLNYSYLMYFPFDYNQVILFFVICSSYFFVKGMETNKSYFFYLSGSFVGLFIMSKQTGILYAFLITVFMLIFGRKLYGLNVVLNSLTKSFVGCIVAILPGMFYLFYSGAFEAFVQQITNAGSSKGPIIDIFIRFFRYGFSFRELLVAYILVLYVIEKKHERSILLKKMFNKVSIGNIASYILFCFFLYKFLKIFMTLYGTLNNFKIFILCNVLYFSGWVSFRKIDIVYKSQKFATIFSNKYFNKSHYLKIICIGFLIAVFILLIENNGFFIRSFLYSNGAAFSLKRSLVTISFWFVIIWSIYKIFWGMKLKKNTTSEKSVLIFISFIWTLIFVGCLSSVVEELYIMPIFALLVCLIMSSNRNLVLKVLIMIVSVFILATTITQKQVQPYSWHGWTSIGLKNPGVQYVNSTIGGIEDFVLDHETETAYENIVEAIKLYSEPYDTVYEFPHITLFNILTKRNLGTFAVTHYFDVCPDYIAELDAKTLNENPPKIVIWNEFGEANWKFHEDYFRAGNPSGQRKIEDFYENIVMRQYQLVYSYKDIYVWVRNNDNAKNKYLF